MKSLETFDWIFRMPFKAYDIYKYLLKIQTFQNKHSSVWRFVFELYS